MALTKRLGSLTLGLLPLFTIPSTARADHPSILVTEDMYPELRERASQSPWAEMKEGVRDADTWTYAVDGTFRDKMSSMARLANRNALAVILYPEEKDKYVQHLAEQLTYWEDLALQRPNEPLVDWYAMIYGGGALLLSSIALDVIHDDLTPEQLEAIEPHIQTWFDFERTNITGSWVLAKYGGLLAWSRYMDDRGRFETYAQLYDARLMAHFTRDGIALVGGNYAFARLAGSEYAKTYAMDILTFADWKDYYNDPTLAAFHEWFYAGMITPTKNYAVFHDCRDIPHSGTQGHTANYRVHKFSEAAAAHAAWVGPDEVPDIGFLSYVLMDQPLPEPEPPESRVWWDGYAAFYEADPHEHSVMGALWTPDTVFQHDHYEVNAIHITGLGKTLVRNTGYEGAGNGPVGGYTWDYLAKFDIREEWDYAVGSNIAYLDRDRPHSDKKGAGMREWFLQPYLDYVSGDSDGAVVGGQHHRNLVFVKSEQDAAAPYFVVFDEMRRDDTTGTNPMRVALHPASANVEVVSDTEEYRWDFGDDVFTTIHLATPAEGETRLKDGGLSQMDEVARYIHAEYPYDGGETQQQAVTLILPHQGVENLPDVQRIGGPGYTGAAIQHAPNLVDVAVETGPDASMAWNDVTIDGQAGLFRYTDGAVAYYMVRKGTNFQAPGVIGFESPSPVSVVLRGDSGMMWSFTDDVPVTMLTDRTDLSFTLNGREARVLSREPGRITIEVGLGFHELEVIEGDDDGGTSGDTGGDTGSASGSTTGDDSDGAGSDSAGADKDSAGCGCKSSARGLRGALGLLVVGAGLARGRRR